MLFTSILQSYGYLLVDDDGPSGIDGGLQPHRILPLDQLRTQLLSFWRSFDKWVHQFLFPQTSNFRSILVKPCHLTFLNDIISLMISTACCVFATNLSIFLWSAVCALCCFALPGRSASDSAKICKAKKTEQTNETAWRSATNILQEAIIRTIERMNE